MKITRRQLRNLILNELNINENKASLEDDDIKWHFVNSKQKAKVPHRFVGISNEMLQAARKHPKEQKGYYEDLAKKKDFKNYQVITTKSDQFPLALVELEGVKKVKKKDYLLGQDLRFIGLQVKKLGKQMSDYDYYSGVMGTVFAVEKGKSPPNKNMRKKEYTEEQLNRAYEYSPIGR